MRRVLRGGRVLAADALSAPRADVVIENTRIAAILPAGTPVADAEVFDASARLVIPGLVNTHTHGHGGLAKGAGDKWDLALLLAQAPWTNAGRNLDDKRLSTTLTAVEMLKKGCTAAYDLPAEFPGPTQEGLDAMAEAYIAVGLRAILAPMVADLTFFQATPGLVEALPEPLRERAEAMRANPGEATLATIGAVAQTWSHDHANIRLGIAPTIPLFGTDAFLKGCRALARDHGLPMQTHVAEARFQAGGAVERYGKTLLAHMDDMGCVGPWFSVAHGVWLTDADLALLAERGGSLAHNPGSNMRLASGIAPIRRALRAGVTVGLGTDGSGSSDNQNMFESMRLAAFASRIIESESEDDWLGTAETVLLATAGSSRLMGLGGSGKIEVGASADIVLLDLNHINWMPFNDAANQIVWTEDGAAVRDVMIGGDWKLRGGKVLGVDEVKLASDAQAAVDRLWSANAATRAFCEAVSPHVACHCRGLAKKFTGATRLLPVH
ncbi:amidohydrolase family protein [Humitalea sp. 24SJ18S-53]|uniref:amidohydrolase family protein n=1 Tax=Humitalea sp. 24SJ18S-53 TaxID=3422307 RepID=UPI003D67AE5C